MLKSLFKTNLLQYWYGKYFFKEGNVFCAARTTLMYEGSIRWSVLKIGRIFNVVAYPDPYTTINSNEEYCKAHFENSPSVYNFKIENHFPKTHMGPAIQSLAPLVWNIKYIY